MLAGTILKQVLSPVARRTGLENCAGCKRREVKLNELDQGVRDRLTAAREIIRARLRRG